MIGHSWMFDAVDIQTTWIELRAMANRGQMATLEQVRDVEENLPFALAGLDSDNGGEFINHHMQRYAQERPRPLAFTRARPTASTTMHMWSRKTTPMCGNGLGMSAMTIRQWFP